MKKTIEMILMTLIVILIAVFVGSTLTSCSLDDDDKEKPEVIIDPVESDLTAIIVNPEHQLIDIIPDDVVLWGKDIIAYNPETGDLLIRGGERIEEKSYPIPTQYKIVFYQNGEMLFDAWLNNSLSSMIGGTGMMLFFLAKDQEGFSHFQLRQIIIKDEDGHIEGELTDREKAGLATFEQLMRDAGKCFTWDE